MSLSVKILIGLGLGVVLGLTFGDACAPLAVVGTIYIKLMQMTITPYMIFSIVLGIGKLDPDTAKRVASRGLAVLVATWALGFVILRAMPLAFPRAVASAFYSGNGESKDASDASLIDIFVPSNIFHALAEDHTPSIILFCICVGVVLMTIPDKELFTKTAETLAEAIERIARGVTSLTPVGVFAMSAAAAGTTSWAELARLQVYGLTYVATSLFTVVVVLPLFIRTVYPISYASLLRHAKEPLLIAFTTGSSFVALPIVGDKLRALLREQSPDGELTPEQDSYVDVILPMLFAFPAIGGVIDLMFLEFVGWSHNVPMGGTEFGRLVALGLPALFADPIPFLLKQFHLPSDAYSVYLVANIFLGYFVPLLNSSGYFTVTLLGAAWGAGKLRVGRLQAISFVGATVVLGGALVFGMRALLTFTTGRSTNAAPPIMALALDDPQPATVVARASSGAGAGPASPPPPRGTLLHDIVQRGVLRVGYVEENIPWSYFNARHELVGYDIAFAHALAKELGVRLELVPATGATIADELERRAYDVAAVGLPITPERIDQMDFAMGHRSLPSVFVVPDYRKKEFKTRASIAALPGLRIAVLGRKSRRAEAAAKAFPRATIVVLDRIQDFFEAKPPIADAWYTEAGKGAAYAALYPLFDSVEDTAGAPPPEAYPVPKGEASWLAYLNTVLVGQRENGFEQATYETYVLGKRAAVEGPRWCLARNVFHWLD